MKLHRSNPMSSGWNKGSPQRMATERTRPTFGEIRSWTKVTIGIKTEEPMKHFTSLLSVLILLGGCTQSDDQNPAQLPSNAGRKIELALAATQEDPQSRGSLIPNDDKTYFTSKWTEGDRIGVYAIPVNSEGNLLEGAQYRNIPFSYRSSTGLFHGTLSDCSQNFTEWCYFAYYPYSEDDTNIPFESMRGQISNTFNSKYDHMQTSTVHSATAELGKTNAGEAIRFAFSRSTVIHYFHFTTDAEGVKDEKVLTVKLSLIGNNAFNFGSHPLIVTNYGRPVQFMLTRDQKNAYDTITLTYDPQQAPTAADFTAWINSYPCIPAELLVEITTETNIVRYRNSNSGALSAGTLHKIEIPIPADKWSEHDVSDIPINEWTGGNDEDVEPQNR